jgi:NhaA family Na+:H+ antiporter
VYEDALAPAWPIACAIDVAVTYYVLRTILPHSGALPFALLMAIVSDAIGFLIVAPRPHLVLETRAGGAALLLAAIGLAALLRALKVRAFSPYLFACGALSWLAFYREGLHPAFALIPIVPFLPHEPRHVDLFADPPDNDAVHHAEHEWHMVVQGVIFMFGLVNAGVVLKGYDTASLAVISAALVGRPAGILIAVGAAVAAGLHLPGRMGWRELLVVALATSSGFAIALFLATGLLATGPVLAQAKIGVLGSAAGAALAFLAARLLKVGKLAH